MKRKSPIGRGRKGRMMTRPRRVRTRNVSDDNDDEKNTS